MVYQQYRVGATKTPSGHRSQGQKGRLRVTWRSRALCKSNGQYCLSTYKKTAAVSSSACVNHGETGQVPLPPTADELCARPPGGQVPFGVFAKPHGAVWVHLDLFCQRGMKNNCLIYCCSIHMCWLVLVTPSGCTSGLVSAYLKLRWLLLLVFFPVRRKCFYFVSPIRK